MVLDTVLLVFSNTVILQEEAGFGAKTQSRVNRRWATGSAADMRDHTNVVFLSILKVQAHGTMPAPMNNNVHVVMISLNHNYLTLLVR